LKPERARRAGDTRSALILSLLCLLSACILLGYLEAFPHVWTPLEDLRIFIFPKSPSTSEVAVQAPPAFDLSEGNLLLAWLTSTVIGICLAMFRALSIQMTEKNAQPRAIALVCSMLAATCLVAAIPQFLFVYRITSS